LTRFVVGRSLVSIKPVSGLGLKYLMNALDE
jgi:hypothetical protein